MISFLLKLLAPIGWLYFLGTKIRMRLMPSFRTEIPVICVGNIMAGGVGKTPLVIEIVEYLKKKGQIPHVISRGYGAKLQNVKVDPNKHNAKEVGDEPLMLSQYVPVWIGKNRKYTAKSAMREGATILVMDDGFQNKNIRKDFAIIVFDGKVGIGNGLGLPIGRLREPLSEGLKRANAVVMAGKDRTKLCKKIKNVPVYFTEVAPQKIPDMRKKYLAFAGIGRPEKFYESLRILGTRVIETHSFPDHYMYKESDLRRLKRAADKKGLSLITTEKDYVRLPKTFQKETTTLPIKMVFQKPDFFKEIDRLID
ncbi:MAG: tetraacyldisaccharide 4'-kinase [Alphaproteobacteria bacterium]|nr:tetraacyldisaccharide 4'-kinase [Alphaproteobacteria bacterium]MBN2779477.1 tetraacyldisaccharide 4'-kinase [Alphaproteobacteria bacterium]